MLYVFFCCNIHTKIYADSSQLHQEITMNWFPTLSAIAVVVTAFLGVDHPSRAIIIQLSIAAITFIWMGIGWWKESKLSIDAI
jgi:hypothetical protein